MSRFDIWGRERENGLLELRSSACLYSLKCLEGVFSQVLSSDQRTVPVTVAVVLGRRRSCRVWL